MAHIEYGTSNSSDPRLRVTPERSVRIFLNGELVAISQGSPYGLAELALGYLLSEGIVSDRDRLVGVVADEAAAEVRVVSEEHADVPVPLHRVTSAGCARSALLSRARNAAGSPEAVGFGSDAASRVAGSPSAAGSCRSAASSVTGSAIGSPAAAGLGSDAGCAFPFLETPARFFADALVAGMEELCGRSPRRNAGECVHGCGLGDGRSPQLLLVREDIGRHNAMDKIVGQAWLDRMPLCDKALLITGRISCEMALKAYRAGCPVLVSCKSATDEAVARAAELGVTLVSHCRAGFLRVLSWPERIAG